MSLEVHDSTIVENTAIIDGGAIYAQQYAGNPPSNLLMYKPERNPKGFLLPFSCSALHEGVAREWNYSNSSLHITSSEISDNHAGRDGGGLHATNLQVISDNNAINRNTAKISGWRSVSWRSVSWRWFCHAVSRGRHNTGFKRGE
jgi:predicted outer membrane repeat protein